MAKRNEKKPVRKDIERKPDSPKVAHEELEGPMRPGRWISVLYDDGTRNQYWIAEAVSYDEKTGVVEFRWGHTGKSSLRRTEADKVFVQNLKDWKGNEAHAKFLADRKKKSEKKADKNGK